jgi:hypothetical protein
MTQRGARQLVLEGEVSYMGEDFALRLHPRPSGGFTLYLYDPAGTEILMGDDPVASVEAAQQRSLVFLRARHPLGTSHTAESQWCKRLVDGDDMYVLMLDAMQDGLFHWGLYSADGELLANWGTPVDDIDDAEVIAWAYLSSPMKDS